MADTDDKTEAPTPKRLSEARAKGQVARSTDLQNGAGLLLMTITLWVFGRRAMDILSKQLHDNLHRMSNFEASEANIVSLMKSSAYNLLDIVMPFMLLFLLSGILINLLQVGLLFTPDKLTPKLENAFSLSGLKKMFSKNSLVELIKGLFKVAIVSLVLYLVLSKHYEDLLMLIDMDFRVFLSIVAGVTFELCWKVALLFIILGVGDFFWQKKEYIDNLKMSKHDVKDESKMSEGDPQLKAKIRSLMRDMAQKMSISEVPQATVVITNPTFIAIALKYSQGSEEAPKVLAKGKRLNAEKIRDLANDNKVPIVENKPLARSLYDTIEPGDEIPAEFFTAVAEVLAYVYKQKMA